MAPIKLVTWNLRFDSKPDNITVEQSLANLPDPLTQPTLSNDSTEKPWSTRRIKAAELILQSGVVIADFQEALVRQVNDMVQLLGPDTWDFIGVGRDDGVAAGEFSPIFFNKSFIEVLSWDTFWLSNTPFVPSKFPGAGSVRICTAAHLSYTPPDDEDSTPIEFTLLNTHLDDQSDDQRRLGASLILTRAKFEAVNTGGAVIITGDFNSTSSGSDSGAYSIITGAIPPVAIPADFAAKFSLPADTDPGFHGLDTRATTPALHIAGNFATFTGFSSNGQIQNGMGRIDFVFGDNLSQPKGLWAATDYFVPVVLSDDGVLASDHRAVFVSLDIENGSDSDDEDDDLTPPNSSGCVIA